MPSQDKATGLSKALGSPHPSYLEKFLWVYKRFGREKIIAGLDVLESPQNEKAQEDEEQPGEFGL